MTSLVDDLCLGLKAESVRIDRMPGRATVGIEVPNHHQETIFRASSWPRTSSAAPARS